MDINRLTKLRNALLMLASEYRKITTTQGDIFVIGDIAAGNRAFSSEDGVPASNGTYILEDGSTVTISEGFITEVAAAPSAETPLVEEEPVTPTPAPEEPVKPEEPEEITETPVEEIPEPVDYSIQIKALEDKMAALAMQLAEVEKKVKVVEETPAVTSVIEQFEMAKPDYEGNKAAQAIAKMRERF